MSCHTGNDIMAEIKSSLDLIMEKTEGMTLSDEKKTALRRKDLKGKIRGILQRYLDLLIDKTALAFSLEHIKKHEVSPVDTVFAECVLERLDPDMDNERLFDILDLIPFIPASDVRLELHSFAERCHAFTDKLDGSARAFLASKGISGSAVYPNLLDNEQRQEWEKIERARFTERLKSLFLP